jgi:hypothetical protein
MPGSRGTIVFVRALWNGIKAGTYAPSKKQKENDLDITNKSTGPAQPEADEEKDREIAAAARTMLLAAFTISLLSPVAAYVLHFAY